MASNFNRFTESRTFCRVPRLPTFFNVLITSDKFDLPAENLRLWSRRRSPGNTSGGDCLEPGMLLRGFTEAQLREFVRICRELEGSLDGYLIPAGAEYEGNDDGGVIIVQKTPPWVLREGREKRGGYR